ncbi:MAG: PhnB protein; putative DNA binding 3-demethylubiquinone-9 3-methyltransferase domain protein [uncultured Sphingomonas sp.]|uniref:PhnB protein putative DNA binding 3-demethylubiquinone-9 3-methyltransferase domain protein n=1 Tax=uncultured Sphingomonas sp. TaxID=158754 RepID=A0A6J4SSS4_9SPHN|nr:VOC family protein [uncultured Sphingomonas sp.]CAA9504415.1 MAG: PhnB protein; putative DNA binding 3-demethylubiquinone-9 3-methyltransferase domain protein [uncultured Sphingomonas sp.]
MERSEQQGPAAGVTPHISIADRRGAEAVEFYKAAFGARELARMPTEDGRLMHAHLLINEGSLMLHDEFPEHVSNEPSGPPNGCTLHLQVRDADAVWNQALGAGASVVMALEDQFWGDRYGVLRDPFGHRWSIGAPAVPKQD